MSGLFKNIIWAIATLMVLGLSLLYRPGTESFEGLVESTTLSISTNVPGTIRSVNVQVGQQVKKGQVLMELTDANLNLTINEAQYNLKKLKLEHNLVNELASSSGSNSMTPMDLLIRQLEEDLKIKLMMQASLKVVALQDGIIGDVFFRPGESIQAFQILGTLYSPRATKVRGFLLESLPLMVKVNDVVVVQSATEINKMATGYVKDLGQRYVELPLRLKQPFTEDVQAWAREVEIILPEDNLFLPFERVRIISKGIPKAPVLEAPVSVSRGQ